MFISYAQNYEDIMLFRALKGINHGFYVDVGAMDPTFDSVTKAFYERGWRGINIEPVKYWHEKLEQERPEDTNLNVAVFDKPGILKLYDIPDTGLTTGNKETAAKHAKERDYAFTEITVPALTLDDILRDHSGEIHFLKIDVEGAEKEALLGIDLKKIRPWIILVEATKPNSSELNHQLWENLITDQGYQFVYFDGLNRFYLAKEKGNLAQAFTAPPNVFDNFVRVDQLNLKNDLTKKENQIETLHSDLADKEIQIETLFSDLKDKENQIETLFFDLEDKENQIETLHSDLASKKEQTRSLRLENIKNLDEINILSSELAEIKNSKSWKLAILTRRVGYKLAPPESPQAKILKNIKISLYPIITKFQRRRQYRKYKDLVAESQLFQKEWYLSRYPDVATAGVAPLKHYLLHGGFEGRDPNPDFNSAWYLNTYEDVKQSGVNPLIHYLKYGRNETRNIRPTNDKLMNDHLVSSVIKDDAKYFFSLIEHEIKNFKKKS